MFSAEQYYMNRDNISDAMFAALSSGLQQEVYVRVLLFQLDFVAFSEVLLQKLLSIAVQDQANTQEGYIQQATVYRQQTVSKNIFNVLMCIMIANTQQPNCPKRNSCEPNRSRSSRICNTIGPGSKPDYNSKCEKSWLPAIVPRLGTEYHWSRTLIHLCDQPLAKWFECGISCRAYK
jgi:hypothetical protein